jgi:hypothetical protein
MIKNCLFCNQPFDAKPSELKRNYAKFCSLSCSSKYFGKQKRLSKIPNVICSYCNKSFYKNNSKMKGSKSNLYFCCRQHKDLAQRIGGIKEIQPSHYGDELAHYRSKALANYPHYCVRCGYDKNISALVVHHKDRNRVNNSLDNLELICANCHAIEHWALD